MKGKFNKVLLKKKKIHSMSITHEKKHKIHLSR